MTQANKNEILSLFKEADALLQGHFKLTSGKHSEWYLEKMAFRPGWSGLKPGTTAIVVEDILTTGGSIQEVVECLKQKGVALAGIYVLVDRTGGAATIDGQPVGSVFALKVAAFDPEDC